MTEERKGGSTHYEGTLVRGKLPACQPQGIATGEGQRDENLEGEGVGMEARRMSMVTRGGG